MNIYICLFNLKEKNLVHSFAKKKNDYTNMMRFKEMLVARFSSSSSFFSEKKICV